MLPNPVIPPQPPPTPPAWLVEDVDAPSGRQADGRCVHEWAVSAEGTIRCVWC